MEGFLEAKNRLKSVQPKVREFNALDAITVEQQSLEAFKTMTAVNMELWYEPLAQYTFETVFIPMTKQLAVAFVNAYQKYLKGNLITLNTNGELEDPNLESLRLTLNDYTKKWESGTFVKLSTRSPKYSALALKKAALLLKSHLERIDQDAINNPVDPTQLHNLKQIALFTAKLKGLKVQNGLEAIQLLASSERIYDDFQLCLKNDAEGKVAFQINLVAREWKEIPCSMEFRAFVPNGEITAFLQDFDHLYFQELEGGFFEKVSKECNDFFVSTIRPIIEQSLKINRYVIDFAWTPERIYVIELNPFGEGTGAAPFDWHNPCDRKIIMEGPFTAKKVDFPPSINANSMIDFQEILEKTFSQ